MSDPIIERAENYLRKPYGRIVVPELDGTFRGEITEFPGCIVTGEDPGHTLSALEDAALSWLIAAISRGQSIPEPIDSSDFSGRTVLRMPRSLHKRAARLAEREGVSLNQFIVAALAESVGERTKQASHSIINLIAAPSYEQIPVAYTAPWVIAGPMSAYSAILTTEMAAKNPGNTVLIVNTMGAVDPWQVQHNTR